MTPASTPLRVRIHLNLAKPERAENAVKIQSPKSGAWITVGYATQLLLERCTPVVDLAAQDKIRQGSTRKIPHAFIEGDLRHFVGRIRSKAPPHLVALARPHLVEVPASEFATQCQAAKDAHASINYNPRFARCFYRDQPARDQISERFEGCDTMAVVGWQFHAAKPRLSPLLASDLCEKEALAKTKVSETLAIRRGRQATEGLLEVVNPAPPRRALR